MESRKLSYFLSYSADFAWFSILLTRKKMKIAKKSGNNENLAKRSERILAFLHRKLFRYKVDVGGPRPGEIWQLLDARILCTS